MVQPSTRKIISLQKNLQALLFLNTDCVSLKAWFIVSIDLNKYKMLEHA